MPESSQHSSPISKPMHCIACNGQLLPGWAWTRCEACHDREHSSRKATMRPDAAPVWPISEHVSPNLPGKVTDKLGRLDENVLIPTEGNNERNGNPSNVQLKSTAPSSHHIVPSQSLRCILCISPLDSERTGDSQTCSKCQASRNAKGKGVSEKPHGVTICVSCKISAVPDNLVNKTSLCPTCWTRRLSASFRSKTKQGQRQHGQIVPPRVPRHLFAAKSTAHPVPSAPLTSAKTQPPQRSSQLHTSSRLSVIPPNFSVHFNSKGEINPAVFLPSITIPETPPPFKDSFRPPFRFCIAHGCITPLPHSTIEIFCDRCAGGDASKSNIVPILDLTTATTSYNVYPQSVLVRMDDSTGAYRIAAKRPTAGNRRTQSTSEPRQPSVSKAEKPLPQANRPRKCQTPNCEVLIPTEKNWSTCPSCILNRWKVRLAEKAAKEHVGPASCDDGINSSEAGKLGVRTKEGMNGFVRDGKDTGSGDRDIEMQGASSNALSSMPSDLRDAAPPDTAVDASANSMDTDETLTATADTTVAERSSPMLWDSDLTDLTSSDDDDDGECDKSNPDSGSEPTGWKKSVQASPSKSSDTHLSPTKKYPKPPRPPWTPLPPGSRVCTIRSCHTVIPPSEQYRWKMCSPCRTQARERAREKSRSKKLREISDAYGELFTFGVLGKAKQRTSRSMSCESEDIDEGAPGTLRRDAKADVDKAPRSRSSRRVLHPQYPHLNALLSHFQARFTEFLRSRKWNLPVKPNSSKDSVTTTRPIFVFTGEYSIVAEPERVYCGKEVRERITSLKNNVGAKVGLNFKLKSRTSRIRWGFITCLYKAPPFLLPSTGIPSASTQKMHVELKITVLPDESHIFFPGERTIVRFRLA